MKPHEEQDEDDEPRRAPLDPVEAFVLPLWHARLWILVLCGAGLAIGTFRAAVEPNSYEATGKLIVRAGSREGGSAESRIVGSGGEFVSSREAVANEMHLLSNPRLYENVVRKVGADRLLAPYDPQSQGVDHGFVTEALHAFQNFWFQSFVSTSPANSTSMLDPEAAIAAATKILQRALFVRSEMGSSVLTVICTTSSPRLSAELVNTFMTEAVANHLAVFSSNEHLGFLDRQITAANTAVANTEKALSEYRIGCGVFDLDVGRAGLLEEAQELEGQIIADEARIEALKSVKSQREADLAAEKPKEKVPVERPPLVNPTHQALTNEIFELRRRIVDIESAASRTQDEKERQRRGLEKQIEALTQERAEVNEYEEFEPTFVDQTNPRYERIYEQLSATKIELVSLQSEAAKRKERRTAVKDALADIERCSPTLNFLDNEARKARQQLEQFSTARSQVSVLDLLDQMNLINLRKLQDAGAYAEKSGPRRGRTVLIGGLAGGLAGVGFALLRSRLGRRFRAPADVRRLLGTPILGLVPEISTKELAARRAASGSQARP